MTRLTLLTSADCELCEHAKAILDRLRGELDLDVETLDLHTEAGRAAAEPAGIVFPPGVLLDGQPFSQGRLSERKLRRALARLARPRS